MISRFLYSISTVFFFVWTSSSAINADTAQVQKASLENYESLMQGLVNESISYKEFKLLKTSDIEILKNAYRAEEASFKNRINELDAKIVNLEAMNKALEVQNKKILEKNELLLAKANSSSSIIYISILIILALLLAFYIYRFNELSHTYKEHKNVIYAVESEFEDYKRKAIEREQRLKRELIDAKNAFIAAQKKASPVLKESESNPVSRNASNKIDLDELLSKEIESKSSFDEKRRKNIADENQSNVRKLEPIKDEKQGQNITRKRKG